MVSTTYINISQKVFKKILSKMPEDIEIERNIELEKAGILLDYKQYYATMLFTLILGSISSLIFTLFINYLFPSNYSLPLFVKESQTGLLGIHVFPSQQRLYTQEFYNWCKKPRHQLTQIL